MLVIDKTGPTPDGLNPGRPLTMGGNAANLAELIDKLETMRNARPEQQPAEPAVRGPAEAGETQPDPEKLHALQLTEWLLESKELPYNLEQYRADLLSHVQQMYGLDQKLVQRQFLNPADAGLGAQVQTAAQGIEGLDPLGAATRLVESLYESLSKVDPALAPLMTD